ncbi:hypothetical protein EMN47_04420 [Prolixibacteraceae bacterium JC049]|nr:hypothetical protein [Prolixibacteraceae bacterium JC049]
MDKNTLYRLIAREISDLDLLVKGDLDNSSINLAINRAESLLDELKLLQSVVGNGHVVEEKVVTPVQSEVVKPEPVKEEVIVEAPEEVIDEKEEPPVDPVVEEPVEELPQVVVEERIEEPELDEPEEDIKPEPVFETTVEPVVEMAEEPSVEEEKKAIGENFKAERSLNDIIAEQRNSRNDQIAGSVSSLRKSIGINDRILFIRELFDGDADRYNSTVEFIDECDKIEQAVAYLKEHFQWKKNDVSSSFLQLIKRKFA